MRLERRRSRGCCRRSRSRSSRSCVGGDARRRPGDTLGLRLPRLPRGRRPGARRASPPTTRRSRAPAASACSTTRPRSSRWCCRSALLPATIATWLWIGLLDRGVRDRRLVLPVSRADEVAARPARRAVVAVPVRASSSARSARSCSLLFAIGWRWLDRRPSVLGVAAASGRRSRSSPASSSCGRC